MKITALLTAAAALALAAGLASAQPAGGAAAPVLVDTKAPCFKWPAGDWDGDGVPDRLDRCPNTKKGCTVDGYGCPSDQDGDGVCDGLDQCPDTPKGKEVDENGCAKDGSQGAGQGGASGQSRFEHELVTRGEVRFENINFETGNATLLPGSEASLNEAGATLERYPMLRLEVGGHTDSRGSDDANMKLSQARAETVRQYLLDHFKLDSASLTAKGYGETRLLNNETTDEERFQNRRVELKVLNPEALPGNVKIVK